MPNGHGGFPRFGSPVLILVLGAVVHLTGWLGEYEQPVLLVLAAGFGWKLAEHLHLWHVLEYDGAMVTPQEAKKARIKTTVATIAYVAIAAFALLSLMSG